MATPRKTKSRKVILREWLTSTPALFIFLILLTALMTFLLRAMLVSFAL